MLHSIGGAIGVFIVLLVIFTLTSIATGSNKKK